MLANSTPCPDSGTVTCLGIEANSSTPSNWSWICCMFVYVPFLRTISDVGIDIKMYTFPKIKVNISVMKKTDLDQKKSLISRVAA